MDKSELKSGDLVSRRASHFGELLVGTLRLEFLIHRSCSFGITLLHKIISTRVIQKEKISYKSFLFVVCAV